MFQALSSLFFGEVEEVSAEINGPKPCVSEADEEGWMLVNLPGETDCATMEEGGIEARSTAELIPQDSQSNPPHTPSKTEHPALTPARPQSRRRTHKARSRAATALVSSDPFSAPPGASLLVAGVPTAMSFKRRARLSTPSTSSVSPGSSGSERGCMDESWFVTPPPCFNAEGATAESSPMEDLLIEHPSMSVYVSPGNLSMISNGNLSVVGEESIASMMGSVSRVAEPTAAPAARNTIPTRVTRGAAAQAGTLAKVTQVARVQRGKARTERRHLGCNRIQRQNRTREQVTRHGARTRNAYLHQPCQRSVCH